MVYIKSSSLGIVTFLPTSEFVSLTAALVRPLKSGVRIARIIGMPIRLRAPGLKLNEIGFQHEYQSVRKQLYEPVLELQLDC